MKIIIQARMQSKRLPGKVLKECAGKPILQWVIERAQQTKSKVPVAIATSIESFDDCIEYFCKKKGIDCYRGEHANVLARYTEACSYFSTSSCIRISADSPLIDPRVIDMIIEAKGGADEVDLVTNIAPRTFPKGQSVELIKKVSLDRLIEEKLSNEEKEHVTLGFYKRATSYKIRNIKSKDTTFANLQLSIDTLDDFKHIETLMKMQPKCGEGRVSDMSWEELAKRSKNLL